MSNASLIALEQAIQFESDGHDYYLELSTKLTDTLARALFRSLAEDEMEHIKRVREIHDGLKDKPGWPSVTAMIARKSGVQDPFEAETLSAQGLPANAELPQALGKAVDLERQSIQFYRDRLVQATCEGEKQFFSHLVAQEEHHKRVLEAALKKLCSC